MELNTEWNISKQFAFFNKQRFQWPVKGKLQLLLKILR